MATQSKVPDGLSCEQRFQWHVADKRSRYHIELDEGQSLIVGSNVHRLAVKFTPCVSAHAADTQPHWIVFYNADKPSPTTNYDGPPWKRHHQAYYAEAALLEMIDQGILSRPLQDKELLQDKAAEQAPALPLPPTGPPCPGCGTVSRYETAYVGGRGTCWRHICPQSCGYIDRWKS